MSNRVRNDGGNRPDWQHLVQFYEDDNFLAEAVADFLSDGLLAGDPVVVLSTPGHRDALIRWLARDGVVWDEVRRAGRLTWMDARTTLESIMMGRTADPDRFRDHIGAVIQASLRGRDGRAQGTDPAGGGPRVRVYGELVDLLWREGNADAALALEDLWNELGRDGAFSLLCAYSRGNIYREDRGRLERMVCDRHSHELPMKQESPPEQEIPTPAGDV